jgi:hypothetical protein
LPPRPPALAPPHHPNNSIVNDAAAALGGRERVLPVKTLVIEGEGSNGNLGQDTIGPDALAKNPKPLKFQPVDGELELKDAAMTMQLFEIAGNPHADTLLMAYFPSQRILVEVDAYSPGAAVQPYAANLLENINRRKPKVDRIVPLHGAIVPFGELANRPPSTH